MAGPYPGSGPNNASMRAIEPSWFERLIQAISEARSGEWFDPESGQTFPSGGRLGAVATELTGLAGAARLTANARAGHPLTDQGAASTVGKYADVLDSVGLAAGATPAVALGMRGLGKVAGAAGDVLSVTPGSKAAQRGMIRLGGDERLIPSHATEVSSLEQARDSLGPNMLYSPSIGINKNKTNRFKDHNSRGTVYLIPKIGAFDPATSASVLYNRDAYLPRYGSYALNQWGGGKTGENLAFDKGLANLRLIGGEGRQIPKHDPQSIQMTWSNTGGHKAALANSPHFRSFAQYESDPRGSAVLTSGTKQDVVDAVGPLYDEYRHKVREVAQDYNLPRDSSQEQAKLSAIYRPLLYGDRVERASIVTALTKDYGPEVAQAFSKIASQYRQKFARAPAEYAELQPQGLTPLNEENWAGAMVVGKDEGKRLGKTLTNLPIEYFDPGEITPEVMKRFQGEYGLARRQPLGQALQLPREYRNDPKTPAPYLTGLAGAGKGAQKGAQKVQEAAQAGPFAWLPGADFIPEKGLAALTDYAWNTPGGEDLVHYLSKYAKLHPDDILNTVEFDDIMDGIQKAYAAMLPKKAPKPNNIMEDLAAGDWEPESDPLAALGELMPSWKATPAKTTFGEWKAPSWEQYNIVKSFLAKGGKIGKATPEETQQALLDKQVANWHKSGQIGPNPASKAKKPLTSTGDSALDAEIDALAKGLEPVSGSPETDLSPTGIPWKQHAGSFTSHAEDVASGLDIPEQGIADFVELFKEAGGKVINGKNFKKHPQFSFESPDGKKVYEVALEDLAINPGHYQEILETLLPQVAAHMDFNP